jgi:GT2 family glycosyltransferase
MAFTLIMSTMGRTTELERFFQSLVDQGRNDIRIFLCDQNDDDRLLSVLDAWKRRFPITVVRSDRGLSRGRNAALTAALQDTSQKGQSHIVAFPDDDCWYAPDVLNRVAALFSSDSWLSGLTVRSMSEDGRPSARTSPAQVVTLDRENLFVGSMGISYCIFLRQPVVEKVGAFDGSLGVGSGSPWGAGEESDYLLRAMASGSKLRYEPGIHVFHPDKSGEATGARFLAYARGHGRVLRLNGYSWSKVLKEVVIAFLAFIYRSLKSRKIAVPYLYRGIGYLQGYAHAAPRPALPRLDAERG